MDLAQGGDDLGVRDLRPQLLELVGHDQHHVLDVVVELGRLVLVVDARLADLVGEQAGQDRDRRRGRPPSRTWRPSGPAIVSGAKSP